MTAAWPHSAHVYHHETTGCAKLSMTHTRDEQMLSQSKLTVLLMPVGPGAMWFAGNPCDPTGACRELSHDMHTLQMMLPQLKCRT